MIKGQPTFESALEHLINEYSQENKSNTPDYILAKYLQKSLDAYNETVRARDDWFNVDVWAYNKVKVKSQEKDMGTLK